MQPLRNKKALRRTYICSLLSLPHHLWSQSPANSGRGKDTAEEPAGRALEGPVMTGRFLSRSRSLACAPRGPWQNKRPRGLRRLAVAELAVPSIGTKEASVHCPLDVTPPPGTWPAEGRDAPGGRCPDLAGK